MRIPLMVTGPFRITVRGMSMLSNLRCATILLLSLLPVGCGGSGMFENEMSPSEAAEAAFNPYDADARRRAVTLLANADWGGQPPYLRTYRLLIDDPDPTVRAAALTALGLHGDVTDVPRIAPFLRYRSGGEPVESARVVRWEAAKALQKIHDPQAINPLVDALSEDPDVNVRIAAANALGQYASRAAFDALATALRDDDYAVVKEAHQALTTLTGVDRGERARDWWQWAENNSESLFANQQPYYYPQYVPPAGVLSKVAFWSDPPKIERKQPRTGVVAMDDAGEAAEPVAIDPSESPPADREPPDPESTGTDRPQRSARPDEPSEPAGEHAATDARTAPPSPPGPATASVDKPPRLEPEPREASAPTTMQSPRTAAEPGSATQSAARTGDESREAERRPRQAEAQPDADAGAETATTARSDQSQASDAAEPDKQPDPPEESQPTDEDASSDGADDAESTEPPAEDEQRTADRDDEPDDGTRDDASDDDGGHIFGAGG